MITYRFNKLSIRKRAESLQIDRTIIYGVITKFWTLITGPVSMFLVISYFSSEIQGYYYTFGTVLALRIFIETGFSSVIIAFASHEWSKLHLDKKGYIIGDSQALSRLVSLARIFFRWQFIGGFIALFGIGVGGYFFFAMDPASSDVNWKLPWFFLCVLTILNMWIVPAQFILEGCNQIRQIYFYRLITGVFLTIGTWIAIMMGAELWASVVNATIGLISLIIFILFKYKNFFIPMFTYTISSVFNWRTDLFPMQWRIALSWISGYFLSSFFTPLIFHYQGSVAAGQFGMTWMLFTAISSLSGLWIAPKIPQFGMFIAKKDYLSLDTLFFKSAKISIAIFGLGALALWLIIYGANHLDYSWAVKLSVRLLSPLTAGIFLIGMFFVYFSGPFSSYLRAHGKEPMMWVSLLSALFVSLSSWILIQFYGMLGLSIAYAVVGIFFTFPSVLIIWKKFRAKWH